MMKSPGYRIAVFSLLGVLAACGSSTTPRWSPFPQPPPRDENYHGGPNAMLLKYDANHDGTLTRDELIAGLKAEFDGARHQSYRMPARRTK